MPSQPSSPRSLLRSQMLTWRQNQSPSVRLWEGWQANHHLYEFLQPLMDSGAVQGLCGYVAIKGEYHLFPPPASLKYYLPCTLSDQNMAFVRHTQGEDSVWQRDGAGIWSLKPPKHGDDLKQDLSSQSQEGSRQLWVMVVPCLAVHKYRGVRLGYGGGYYDRYLASLKATRSSLYVLGITTRAGVFDDDAKEALKAEPWDKAVDGLLSPDGLHLINPAYPAPVP